jgi:hypothetical protein
VKEQFGERNCGVLGCISSPYLQARMDGSVIGKPIATVIQKMGLPDKTYQDGSVQYLSWVRMTEDAELGEMRCTETVTVQGGTVASYHFNGNC